MSDALTAFIRARYDEVEETARWAAEEVGDSRWQQRSCRVVTVADRDRGVADLAVPECIDHIVLHDPARVLADVDAKRQMLSLHDSDREHFCPTKDGGSEQFNYLKGWAEEVDHQQECPTLRLLALHYSDHPDYRAEWRLDIVDDRHAY